MMLAGALACAGCTSLKLGSIPTPRPGDWPMFAGNAAHNAAVPGMPASPPSIAWDASTGAGMGTGSPVIVDSFAFVGTLRGEICAYNLWTGKSLGSVALGEAIHGSPIIDRRLAYAAVTGAPGGMVCYDLVDARVVWRKPGDDVELSPLLLHKRLYAGTVAGEFFCLDAATGARLWTFSLPRNFPMKGIRSSPAAAGDVVAFGADDGWIYGLSATTGSLAWKVNTGACVEASPVIRDGCIYTGNRSGSVIAVDTTGQIRWTTEVHARITGNAVATDSLLIVGTLSGEVFGLRRSDGAKIWVSKPDGAISGGGVGLGSRVIFGTLTRQVLVLNAETGETMWKTSVDGRVKSAPSGTFGVFLIATDERTLYAIRGVSP